MDALPKKEEFHDLTMCLILHVPSRKKFDLEALEAAYYTNQNGAGAMWVENGEVKVWKDHNATFKALKNVYESLLGKNFAMHLRFSTHGKVDRENTHPIRILHKETDGIDLFMMHNGVMSDVPIKAKGRSDTWHFARNYLMPVLKARPGLIYRPSFQELLAKQIGSNNKLLFLDNHGRVIVINRTSGALHETGCWISNTYSINGAKLWRTKNTPSHVRAQFPRDTSHEHNHTYNHGYNNCSIYGTNAAQASDDYTDPSRYVYATLKKSDGTYEHPNSKIQTQPYVEEFHRRFIWNVTRRGYVPREIETTSALAVVAANTNANTQNGNVSLVVDKLKIGFDVSDRAVNLTPQQFRFLKWFKDKKLRFKNPNEMDQTLLQQCLDNGTMEWQWKEGRKLYDISHKGAKSMLFTVQAHLKAQTKHLLRPEGFEDWVPKADDPDDLRRLPPTKVIERLGELPHCMRQSRSDEQFIDLPVGQDTCELVVPTQTELAVYGQTQLEIDLTESKLELEHRKPLQIKSARQLAKRMVTQCHILETTSAAEHQQKKTLRTSRRTRHAALGGASNPNGGFRFTIEDVLSSTEDDLTHLIANYPLEAIAFITDLIHFPEASVNDAK